MKTGQILVLALVVVGVLAAPARAQDEPKFKCFQGQLAAAACTDQAMPFLCVDENSSVRRKKVNKLMEMLLAESQECGKLETLQRAGTADLKAVVRQKKKCDRSKRRAGSKKAQKLADKFGMCSAENNCVAGTIRKSSQGEGKWDNVFCQRKGNEIECADGEIPLVGTEAVLNNYFVCDSFAA
jgi:predicted secreted protein